MKRAGQKERFELSLYFALRMDLCTETALTYYSADGVEYMGPVQIVCPGIVDATLAGVASQEAIVTQTLVWLRQIPKLWLNVVWFGMALTVLKP